MAAARFLSPIALTIAGSDSGGGAGVQADLRTFAALGVHGVTAITCVTAQNPLGVMAVQPVRPALVQAQISAIFAELPPRAVKTGMLHSAPVLRSVVAALRAASRRVPLVVDPVMIATSGASLLRPDAVRVLCRELLPLATIVTPNLDEARVLTGLPLTTRASLAEAARRLHDEFGCAALVKGGHLRGGVEAVDVFFDGREEILLSAPRVRGVHTHGTGCTFAAAVTAHLACGRTLAEAVRAGKHFITHSIAASRRIGRHTVLGWEEAGRKADY
jgi:hydroxymethylpyrimidine/phosphomethylpyrimidine kinase